MTIERKHVGTRLSEVVIHGDTIYLAGLVARVRARASARDSSNARAGSRAREVFKDSDLEHGYYLVHGRVEAACGKTWGGPLL